MSTDIVDRIFFFILVFFLFPFLPHCSSRPTLCCHFSLFLRHASFPPLFDSTPIFFAVFPFFSMYVLNQTFYFISATVFSSSSTRDAVCPYGTAAGRTLKVILLTCMDVLS